jgi:tetratricopeptide (TPR) repeat protein
MASAAPPATTSAPVAPTSSPSVITPPAPPARTPAAEARRKELEAAVPRIVDGCAKLIDAGKRRDAWTALVTLRNQLGEPRDVRVETLLAKISLAENRPEDAFTLLAPWADQRDKYDPALSDCYLVAGNAYLAAQKHYQALTIFDWMASKAQGLPLILAAEGCGKALMGLKEYGKAVEALNFAVRYAKDKLYDQVDLIKRIEALLAKARRLADIDLYGEDFVLYRDAETLRRIHKKPKEARAAYLDLVKRFPDGPYADASTLYAALCLVETGKIAEAEHELTALRQANPYGPYSGEAILELGRIALEHHLNPGAARGCFLLLDTWIQEVKSKPVLNIEKLAQMPGAAKKVTTPPAKEKYVDFWGNVKKSEIKPGMLVNPKTCPWYLDDLKEQMAMYMGFLCFVEGDMEGALAWYKRILEWDPATRRMEADGEPNDYMRLKFGAEHGYLVAFPEELAVYKDSRQKLAVLLTDFHYVCQRFDEASLVAQRLLKGEFGMLTGPAREYPQLAYAKCMYWTRGGIEAIPEYMKVVAMGGGGFQSFTQCRAAFTAGNLAVQTREPKTREAGLELLGRLGASGIRNRWALEARIRYATTLIRTGKRSEGLQILETFPTWSTDYKKEADYWFKWYGEGKDRGG